MSASKYADMKFCKLQMLLVLPLKYKALKKFLFVEVEHMQKKR